MLPALPESASSCSCVTYDLTESGRSDYNTITDGPGVSGGPGGQGVSCDPCTVKCCYLPSPQGVTEAASWCVWVCAGVRIEAGVRSKGSFGQENKLR